MAQAPRSDPGARSAAVHPIGVARSDEEIVEGLKAGETWARAALFDRHAADVARVLRRLLGPEAANDLQDLVHDVFVQALCSVGRLRDGRALPAWMRTIATRTAYRAIRARRARSWLRFWEPTELPDIQVEDVGPEIVEACQRTYAVLERFPTGERVAFVLRHVEKLELTETADACGVSLATIKRRLLRAQQRFARIAERDPVLRSWLREGGRWTR